MPLAKRRVVHTLSAGWAVVLDEVLKHNSAFSIQSVNNIYAYEHMCMLLHALS